jgi:hypothetical protein
MARTIPVRLPDYALAPVTDNPLAANELLILSALHEDYRSFTRAGRLLRA